MLSDTVVALLVAWLATPVSALSPPLGPAAAYVVPTQPEAVVPDDVRAHVKARLAGYKVPRDVVLLDELPRNASGKVVVRDLPGVGP